MYNVYMLGNKEIHTQALQVGLVPMFPIMLPYYI